MKIDAAVSQIMAARRDSTLGRLAREDTDGNGWMKAEVAEAIITKAGLTPEAVANWVELGLIEFQGEGADRQCLVKYRGRTRSNERVFLVDVGIGGHSVVVRRISFRDDSIETDSPVWGHNGPEELRALGWWIQRRSAISLLIIETLERTKDVFPILVEY